MSSELQLDVRCLSCCGGDIWWTLTKERQACYYLQVKLCDPCLSALSVPPWPKKRYINTLPFLSLAVEPVAGCTTVCDAWPVRSQTYGYLPSQRALPLPLVRYSFSIPLWIGGWESLNGWLHTKTVYRWTVTHPSTNRAGRRATSLMRPTSLCHWAKPQSTG